VNLRGARAPLLVAIDRIPELRVLSDDDAWLTMGAALTLTELEQRLAGRVPLLAQLIPRFGSRLVRNAATLGGNLATASPIGDSPPVLLALGAELVLAAAEGHRVVSIDDFFTGYRETVLRPGELIVAVRVPQPQAALTWFEKVAKRRVDDISSVAVAMALDLEDGRVRRVGIGLGGVAATPIRARATEQALLGRRWDPAAIEEAAAVLAAEGSPMDDHRASAAYRRATLGQSLRRFHALSHAAGATT
jgi:xanthine dehydrogenase small subunit